MRRPRWWKPRQHEVSPGAVDRLERAELALTVAKQIEHHAEGIAEDTRRILTENHIGPKIRSALGGH